RSARLLVGVVAEVVEVGDLLATPAELLLAMLEVPEVEEVPAREEPFFTEECQDLLADEEHAEAGLRLVELGLLAEGVERRVVGKGGEERPVQRRGGRGLLRAPEARLELEEEAEDVREERVEVGNERPAVVGELREGRRLGEERRDGTPVVSVALDPRVLVG